MADKEVLINGIIVMHGTSIKESRETSTNTTVCFDEVLNQGNRNTAWTIDIERVSYESLVTSKEIEDMLEDMLDNEGMVTVREIVRPRGEKPYIKIRNYYDAIVDGEDYEVKVDDFTVHNLTFKTGKREVKRKYI